MRRFCALLAALLVTLAQARAQGVDGRGELQVEQPAGGAVIGEMLLLKFRVIVRGRIANRDVRQPSLVDLDWQQLGRDSWSEVVDGNSRAYGFERTMAIFPRREVFEHLARQHPVPGVVPVEQYDGARVPLHA